MNVHMPGKRGLKPLWRVAAPLIIFALVMAACGQSTPEPLPDPTTLMQKAADEIQQMKSVRFKLQLTGAPAFVDYNNTIAFVSADGLYVEPDRLAAKVKARLLGVPGEVDVVAIGDRQYMKNAVLTAGRWLEQQFSPGFNAYQFFKSETGVERAIRAFFDIKLAGKKALFGTDVYHITGKARASDIDSLTFGLVRGTDVNADIYINVKTGRVDQIVLVQPDTKTATQDATTWLLDIFDYNVPDIRIDTPDAINAGATPAFEPIRTAVPTLSVPGLPTPGAAEPTAQVTAEATATR